MRDKRGRRDDFAYDYEEDVRDFEYDEYDGYDEYAEYDEYEEYEEAGDDYEYEEIRDRHQKPKRGDASFGRRASGRNDRSRKANGRNGNSRKTNGRKTSKKKSNLIKSLIPGLVAIVLIVIVAAVSLKTGILTQYSYSKEKADLYEYFGLASQDDVAIMMDNHYLDEKALLKDGRYYLSMEMATDFFDDNFYYDEDEGSLLYTTGTETLVSNSDSGDFLDVNGERYLAIDYIKRFANLELITYTGPNHIELKRQWGSVRKADVAKATAVRVLGGIKSPILTEVAPGESVEIINPMDDWCEVKTADGYLGYVENKCLAEYREEDETPVNDVEPMVISHNLRDHKICLGWHQVMSAEANSTLKDVIGQTKGLNVISPTWFSITDNEGNISNIGTADYVATAKEHGLEVWGLVDNFGEGIDCYQILAHSYSRKNLENNLIAAATGLGIDGINIDFETLTQETGIHFAQFIRELSILCRQNNLVLSVDNYVPKEYNAFYHREVQGQYADYVIIMGYDEHTAGTDAGSVASFNFVQEGIEKTLADVPVNQIINGVPFYNRIWILGSTESSSQAVGMVEGRKYGEENGIEFKWDDTAAQYYGEGTVGSDTVKIWLEDPKSIETKLNLMDSNQIAGVACWKLGLEDPEVWTKISEYMDR